MKVVGFDSWTVGSFHYERLVDAFEEVGIELVLIHLGDWGDDAGRASEEMIGKLHVRSISYYASADFDDIIDCEKPDVVLFLSTRSFAHRAFLRYCRARRIPTINLYHGLVRVQAVDGQSAAYKTNVRGQFRFAAERAGKFLKHTVPCYIKALLRTRAEADEWLRFVSDCVRTAVGKPKPAASGDSRASKCCVYTKGDVSHALRTYGLSSEDVVVVGNPDLIRFAFTEDMLASHLRPGLERSREIMYIDTGLVSLGLHFASTDEFINHLTSTRDSLLSQGYSLIVKLHPSIVANRTDETIRAAGIATIDNWEFAARLNRCCAAIVETTTLALIPALMGMPLFLANYGLLRGLAYGEILKSYPRSQVLASVDQIGMLLSTNQLRNHRRETQDWINENSGPLPAEEMPQRVAKVVLQLGGKRNPCVDS